MTDIKNGINQLVELAHGTARSKGWYDSGDRNIGEALALIHSEVSEALEDLRVGKMAMTTRMDGKPEGFPSELADVVIRIADLCGYLGIDLGDAVVKKMIFNQGRPHRHGGKAL